MPSQILPAIRQPIAYRIDDDMRRIGTIRIAAAARSRTSIHGQRIFMAGGLVT